MNNTLLVTVLALLLAALLTVLIIFWADSRASIGSEAMLTQSGESVPEPPALPAEPACEYVLGCYDGRLALFSGGEALPERIYEVWVERLPERDRALLERGIKVESEAELLRLIEDYTS